ncbi:MAG: secretin N-terminal domain-containing protein [Lacipirellulaceae bacterium]
MPAQVVAEKVESLPEQKDSEPQLTLDEALARRGDLTLRGANSSIENALFAISEIWKVNIVVGKDVKGSVTGTFKQTPLREILDSILLANGYSYRAIGDSITVLPAREVGSANPLFSELAIPIQHGDLKELVEAAQLLTSTQGKVRALNSSRSILVIDYSDRAEKIAAFIEKMEDAASRVEPTQVAPDGSIEPVPSQLEVAYFHTQYVAAETVRAPLLAVMSTQGRVEVMTAENRLIVVDTADRLEMVRRVLARIDRPRPQVRITALIYDLSLEDVEQLGLNWNSGGKGNSLGAEGGPNQLLQLDTTTLAPFTAGGAGGALTVQSLTRNFDITAVALALQNANDARLLADPNVTVMDNEVAEWKSVSEIPFQQATQTEFGGNIGTTAFKEAGITLKVQPTIAADGTVEMLIEPEFSRLAGFTPQENQPIIDTRKTSTTVRVANRQTLVLSGLRQRSDTGEFNGIPFLKDIKGIGPLFRSRDTLVRESELIVFIMPEIVGYEDPLDARQYQALDTVNCRLARIPEAEGCPSDGQGCSDCVGDWGDEHLIQLPPVEQEPAMEVPVSDVGPMRQNYEARFRANAPSQLQGRLTDRSTEKDPAPAKRSIWQRMKGS